MVAMLGQPTVSPRFSGLCLKHAASRLISCLLGVVQSWLWLSDCLTNKLFISGIPDVPDLVLRLQVAETISCPFQTSQILPWVLG